MSQPLHIDIPAVLKAKAPGAHIPAFVVRYLERITHVHQMNRFLAAHPDVTGYDFIRLILAEEFHCTASIHGTDNIPQDDAPMLFVSNHPLGGLDGVIEALMIGEHRRYNLRVIVNDLLMYMKPLAELFMPVNIGGGQSREYATQLRNMWDSGCDVLSFPAGACSRKQKTRRGLFAPKQIKDLEWKKSFVQQAVRYQRDVVPIYFDGRNSDWFYNLAYWRKRLGIKLNIEMLYLVDELYGASGKHFTVHVGKPIPWQTFDNTRTPAQWAQWVKEQVYLIPAQNAQTNQTK